MSIRIAKQGLLDTVQDAGRFGYQQWGLNPGGAADKIAFNIANMLVGNNLDEPVIELHYPASSMLFEKDALVAITGADFSASIQNHAIPLNTPVIIRGGTVIEFTKLNSGSRCYLSVRGGFTIEDWLGSCSTNIKSSAGGYKGRRLLVEDCIGFKSAYDYARLVTTYGFLSLGWKAVYPGLFSKQPILRICCGNEYEKLTGASKELLIHSNFTVSRDTDRMGCRLSGIPLQISMTESLVSSGVTAGTIQLLPTGQLIILGADHQTTGGYPRAAHVISADMPVLAQLQPNDHIGFEIVDIPTAEELLLQQEQYLLQLQIACNLRLEEFFTTHGLH